MNTIFVYDWPWVLQTTVSKIPFLPNESLINVITEQILGGIDVLFRSMIVHSTVDIKDYDNLYATQNKQFQMILVRISMPPCRDKHISYCIECIQSKNHSWT